MTRKHKNDNLRHKNLKEEKNKIGRATKREIENYRNKKTKKLKSNLRQTIMVVSKRGQSQLLLSLLDQPYTQPYYTPFEG